jgi:hypothetical protein
MPYATSHSVVAKVGARDLEVVGPRVLATRRNHHVAIELGHEVILFQLSAVVWVHTALSSTGLQVCWFSLRLIFAAP